MRVIRVHAVGGPERLRLDVLPDPPPAPGKVLVRVAVVGLNYVDTTIRRGRAVLQPAFPYVPGLEVAGTVAAIGSGVDPERFPLGSRVAALTLAGGGYAELALARATNTVPLPDGVTLEQGAAVLFQGLTAYHTLMTVGRLAPGETVAILAAAGGVGTLAIQLARLHGAGRIIAIAGGPDKVRLTRALGADEAIDYLRKNFPARVNEITEGRGADLILESVGGQTLERSFECLAPFGRLITFGNASGAQADLNSVWPRLRSKSQSLIGFNLIGAIERSGLKESAIATLLDHLVSGRLRIMIRHCFDFTEASAAQAALENRRTTGKILLKVHQSEC